MHPLPPCRDRPAFIGYAGVFLFFSIGFLLSALKPPAMAPAIAPFMNGTFPPIAPGPGGDWYMDVAYPNLTFPDPLFMLQLPDTSGFFVGGKQGYVWYLPNDTTISVKKLVLDHSDSVRTHGDSGLMNGVLHPEFGDPMSPNKGYLYLFYHYHPDGDGGNCHGDAFLRLSRFTWNEGLEQFENELVLIQQYDLHCWHNGGGMFFGPDGFLYFTIGDFGGANDQFRSSQQIDSFLLGGLFRIDVDMDPTKSHPIRKQPSQRPHSLAPDSSYSQAYFIPNDNPWVNPDGSVLEEFYALGLRSPHRATYDPIGDMIWTGDIGQGSREEISTIAKADNLQWPYQEGDKQGPKPMPNPLIGNDKPPEHSILRPDGRAIIGGFVYRGQKFSTALDGLYIYGDHEERNLSTLDPINFQVNHLVQVVPGSANGKNGISNISTDFEGNIYVLKLNGTDLDGGLIYKLHATSMTAEPPSTLSSLGAFSDLNTLTPIAGFRPYDVNTELWSDGSLKSRWIAIPNDGTYSTSEEQIVFAEEGPWQFPAGTVILKHFELPVDFQNPIGPTYRVETRFIVVTGPGEVYGLTYRWNKAQTDANLLTFGDTAQYEVTLENGHDHTQIWNFPSRSQCITCHNPNAGSVLGLKSSSISHVQLSAWESEAIFGNSLTQAMIPSIPQSVAIDDESAHIDLRISSYLDMNCVHCHRPDGVEAAFDARFSTPILNKNLIGTAGVSRNTPSGEVIIMPRDKQKSQLWQRDHITGETAMPPLAKNEVDDAYIQVLEQWIDGLKEPDCYTVYLTDLTWQSATNGFGPVEIDMSNGETPSGDGSTIKINRLPYVRGLGVHAPSEIVYDLQGGGYESFRANVGVDDEVAHRGSVEFEVWLDDVLVYQSSVLTGADDPVPIAIDVMGVNELKLIVTGAGDGISSDHADWGDAKLIKSCDEFDLGLTMFLEGAFSNPHAGEEGLMRDDLRVLDFIPTVSPYPDQKTCHDSVFDVTGPDGIVDWVWIELRDAHDWTNKIESTSALLQRDGDVVASDGISSLHFSHPEGKYFILLQHRNHLRIISDTAEVMGDFAISYFDFSNGNLAINGSNPLTSLNGVNCLWSGDTDTDGVINAVDRIETWNDRNMLNYLGSDTNLDGVTNAIDRITTWNNRNKFEEISN